MNEWMNGRIGEVMFDFCQHLHCELMTDGGGDAVCRFAIAVFLRVMTTGVYVGEPRVSVKSR